MTHINPYSYGIGGGYKFGDSRPIFQDGKMLCFFCTLPVDLSPQLLENNDLDMSGATNRLVKRGLYSGTGDARIEDVMRVHKKCIEAAQSSGSWYELHREYHY